MIGPAADETMVKGIFRDRALAAEEETDKCTKRPAVIAAKIVKCLLCRLAASLFSAVNVLIKIEVETQVQEGLKTEVQEGLTLKETTDPRIRIMFSLRQSMPSWIKYWKCLPPQSKKEHQLNLLALELNALKLSLLFYASLVF